MASDLCGITFAEGTSFVTIFSFVILLIYPQLDDGEDTHDMN